MYGVGREKKGKRKKLFYMKKCDGNGKLMEELWPF